MQKVNPGSVTVHFQNSNGEWVPISTTQNLIRVDSFEVSGGVSEVVYGRSLAVGAVGHIPNSTEDWTPPINRKERRRMAAKARKD